MAALLLATAIYVFDNVMDTDTVLSTKAPREVNIFSVEPIISGQEKDFFAYGLESVYEPTKPSLEEQNMRTEIFIGSSRLTEEQKNRIKAVKNPDFNTIVINMVKEKNKAK